MKLGMEQKGGSACEKRIMEKKEKEGVLVCRASCRRSGGF